MADPKVEAQGHRVMAAYFKAKGMEERALAHLKAANQLVPLVTKKKSKREEPECRGRDCQHV